jgi:hypothetical protein
MNPSIDFDRLLTSWLETAGPTDLGSETIGKALVRARKVGQRGRFADFLVGPPAWPRPRRGAGFRGLTPVLRSAIVAGLTLALLAAGIWGSGAVRGLLAQPTPSPTPSSTPSLVLPTTAVPTLAANAPTYEAIYLRQSTDVAGTFVDVFVVRPDGRERLIRRLRNTIAGIQFLPGPYGQVSEQGWLAVSIGSDVRNPAAPYGQYAIFDLRDPTRDAFLVPANGAIGGRWSIDGLFAVPHPSDSSIRIVDPRTGSTTELGKIGLFGGGPSIVWTRDGSGILDFGKIMPATGGADVPIDPGMLFADRRIGLGGHILDVCRVGEVDPAGCAGVTRTTVRVFGIGGGNGVDWYATDDPTEMVSSSGFTADGQGLWLTFDRVVNGHHRAVIAVLDRPFNAREIASVDLPADGFDPTMWNFAPDDSQMQLMYWKGPRDNPQYIAPLIVRLDGTQQSAPSGKFVGYVLGSQAESWPAEGDFVTPNPSK